MNKSKKHQYFKSVILTAIVLLYLIFSGPASAILVQISGISGTISKGDSIPFNISIKIDTVEKLPLMHTRIIFNASGDSYDDTCNIYNNLTSTCSYITVSGINHTQALQYGQDFGYGYDYGYGSYYNSGFGYGYGYNDSDGNITIRLTLNTTGMPLGSASMKAEVFSGNNSNYHIFSSDTIQFNITCAENWTYSAWGACSCATSTRTRTGVDQNSCGTTINRILTESCTPTGCGGGGGGGYIAPPQPEDDIPEEEAEEPEPQPEEKPQETKPEIRSNRPDIVPGVGLRNNLKLQAAIEKVLPKGKMSQKAVQNMLRLSAAISPKIDTERHFEATDKSSKITTKMKYNGNKKAKNFVIYEKIPKSFAESTDQITVNTQGKVEIIEKDPEYAIIFSELNPGQTIEISYTIDRRADASVIDEMTSEVYAESIEAPATTQTPASTSQPEKRRRSSVILVFILIFVLVAITGYIIVKNKPKKHITEKKEAPKKPEPHGKKPYEAHEKKPEHIHYDITKEISRLLKSISEIKPFLDSKDTVLVIDANNKIDQISLEIDQAKELMRAGNKHEAAHHIKRGNRLLKSIKEELSDTS